MDLDDCADPEGCLSGAGCGCFDDDDDNDVDLQDFATFQQAFTGG